MFSTSPWKSNLSSFKMPRNHRRSNIDLFLTSSPPRVNNEGSSRFQQREYLNRQRFALSKQQQLPSLLQKGEHEYTPSMQIRRSSLLSGKSHCPKNTPVQDKKPFPPKMERLLKREQFSRPTLQPNKDDRSFIPVIEERMKISQPRPPVNPKPANILAINQPRNRRLRLPSINPQTNVGHKREWAQFPNIWNEFHM